MNGRVAAVAFCLVMVSFGAAVAGDWPTYLHDGSRGGVTDEVLDLPLASCWDMEVSRGPEPAWPPPAGQDYYHRHHDLRAIVAYDRAFQLVGADGMLVFGSSADDRVYALEARTGRIRWTFFTEGPVRFAPTIHDGKVYVGSDDGYVYCLSAPDGSLLWKRQVAPQRRLIPGNGRLISLWPVRTGLVVDQGMVYCTAGLFPGQGAYLVAFDADDGALKYRHAIKVSPQGYMLASPDRLYIPTGRTDPAIFGRAEGTQEGTLPSAGGAYALLVDNVLVTGPGRGAKQLQADDTQTKDAIATFGGLRMLVRDHIAYMQSERELSAFDRQRYLELSRRLNELSQQQRQLKAELKKAGEKASESDTLQTQITDLGVRMNRIKVRQRACYLWTVECDYPYAMIMAGPTLFVGGEDKVAAVDSVTGQVLWQASVDGKACGLAVLEGSLYVSTDRGVIHSFRNGESGRLERIAQERIANPYPKDGRTTRHAAAAEYIASQVSQAKGYCVILDCGEGRLAYELAQRTDMKIVGIERDERKVARARERLAQAGLYGRVAVHHVPDGTLPLTSSFANVVVSDGALRGSASPTYSAADQFRLVRPYGGVLLAGRPSNPGAKRALQAWGQGTLPQWEIDAADSLIWGRCRRGRLDGAGEWTHLYADPGNGACSGDELVQGAMAVQWFGEPGPAEMIDRHHRNVPPLFKDGRLFVPGDNLVYAVDAYNGTVLWKIEIPDSRRLGVFLDCGSMVVDERYLYVVAGDKCHAFDVRTGAPWKSHVVPNLTGDHEYKWGYLASTDSILFGSACKPKAAYTETSYDADLALWYRNMNVVTSDHLFARGKEGDAVLWTYGQGLILNPTITIADGHLYFVETHSAASLADETGRMPIKTLFADGDQFLVCLDAKTGRSVFKRKIDVAHFEEPVYLNCANGVVLLSGSRLVDESVQYSYDAFDATSGAVLWRASHDTGLRIDGGHGEYNRHPTVVGDTVYAWPYAYELQTGKQLEGWQFDRRGHGCGGVSASAQCLFWRGANPWMYDLGIGGGPARLNQVTRPGCWINMIPAGGLILIPEASSGCTCGFSLQTSLAYIPEAFLN
jgi:outer membrane protein assembly factor BamB